MSERTCVYDIVLNGEVVYVGMTCDPARRLRYHRTAGTAPEGSEMVVHQWYENRTKAHWAELSRQQELQPPLCSDLWLQKQRDDKESGYEEIDWDSIDWSQFSELDRWETADRIAEMQVKKTGKKR